MDNAGNKDFKQIMTEYLNAYSQGGMEAVNKLVKSNGLSSNAQKELEEANDLIDRINKYKQKRKASHKSREEWEEVVLNNTLQKHNIH